MAQPLIRNNWGHDREVLGQLVKAGETFHVEPDEVFGLTCQSQWVAANDAAKTAHAKAERAVNKEQAPPAEESN